MKKENKSNDLQVILTQAIEQMKMELGDRFNIDKINLAELERRTVIKIVADKILQTKKKLNDILAANTGKPYDVSAADTERDYYMSADEAKEYGLIDDVITNR